MSKNDGGDPIRLYRDPIPKPGIPRGIVRFPLDPADGPSGLVAGDRADFNLRILGTDGTAYAARYHAVRVVSVEEGKPVLAFVEAGDVVTW